MYVCLCVCVYKASLYDGTGMARMRTTPPRREKIPADAPSATPVEEVDEADDESQPIPFGQLGSW